MSNVNFNEIVVENNFYGAKQEQTDFDWFWCILKEPFLKE